MPTCPRCGATIPEGAVYCGNCGATLNSPTTSMSDQPQTSSQPSTAWSGDVGSGDMQARLEKAMKRTEQLSYAAAIVGGIILILVVVSLLQYLFG